MRERITFETRFGQYDDYPTLYIANVTDGEEYVDYLPGKTDTSIDIELEACEAERVLNAIRTLRMRKDTSQTSNCVIFSYLLLEMCEEDGLTIEGNKNDWEMHSESWQGLYIFGTGVLVSNRYMHSNDLSFGHMFTVFEDCGLVLHVDGLDGPLLLSPFESIAGLYPESQYTLNGARPALG